MPPLTPWGIIWHLDRGLPSFWQVGIQPKSWHKFTGYVVISIKECIRITNEVHLNLTLPLNLRFTRQDDCQCMSLAQPIGKRHPISICFFSGIFVSQLKIKMLTFWTPFCFSLPEPSIKRPKKKKNWTEGWREPSASCLNIQNPWADLGDAIQFLDSKWVWFLPCMRARPLVHLNYGIVISIILLWYIHGDAEPFCTSTQWA